MKNKRIRLLILVGVLAAVTTWGTTQILAFLTRRHEVSTEQGEAVHSEGKGSAVSRRGRSIICEIKDDEAPEISLNGFAKWTVVLGGRYKEEGAEVEDNCDAEAAVEVDGEVDAKTAGEYEVVYKARDKAGNESVKARVIRVVDPSEGERVVHLTFDDGPSEHTARLLDVLAKYGVKVTFFVTGRGEDEMIKREYEEGHTVALHTYTHNYAYLYSSVESYFEDLNAVRDRVERITGARPMLIRFPGGSSNTVSGLYSRGIMSTLVEEVERRGFAYADWNVSSGDAEGSGTKTTEDVFDNVKNTLKDGVSVVLQHDTMGFSVDAVERIIEYGMENGYVFLPMNEGSFLAHHGVNN